MAIQSTMSRRVLMAGALGLSLAAARDGKAVDFIRGDANGDGVVSISDAQFIDSFIFQDSVSVPCMNAADVDDNGRMDLSDAVRILNFLILNGVEPKAPFPGEGPDPTVNEPDRDLGCASYGGGSPIDDPAARLTILDATAPGGADGTFSITVAISSSRPLAGYSGALRAPEGVIAGALRKAKDLSGTADGGLQATTLGDGAVKFGFLSSLTDYRPIPAGPNAQVLLIQACLAEGATAGQYALQLESGELVDLESARAIRPELVSGTLTVLEDVTVAGDCSVPPTAPPPADVMYKLSGMTAPPGGQGTVKFYINSTAAVQGYSFSVDFDEEILSATAIEEVWRKPDGTSSNYGFSKYEINNRDENPGSQGIDEGFLVGAAVFDFLQPVGMPMSEDVEALAFHFQVLPETTASSTEVTFLDGGKGSGQPVHNRITANGRTPLGNAPPRAERARSGAEAPAPPARHPPLEEGGLPPRRCSLPQGAPWRWSRRGGSRDEGVPLLPQRACRAQGLSRGVPRGRAPLRRRPSTRRPLPRPLHTRGRAQPACDEGERGPSHLRP
jgi:hypothetical protein